MAEKSQNKGPRQDEGVGRETKKSTRGFAAMDPQRQRDIASEGGRAAHEQGKAHKFTPEEAREAGRKGGMASGAARASRSKARAAAQAGENNNSSHPHAVAGAQGDSPSHTVDSGRELEDENRM